MVRFNSRVRFELSLCSLASFKRFRVDFTKKCCTTIKELGFYIKAALYQQICATFLVNGLDAALSNQNLPCHNICHFCDDKIFAVATVERNVLQKSNLVGFFTIKQDLEKFPVATFKWPVAPRGEWQQGWTTPPLERTV